MVNKYNNLIEIMATKHFDFIVGETDEDDAMQLVLDIALTAIRKDPAAFGVEVDEWQPIETCTKLTPGSTALIYLDGGVQITALWVVGRWMSRGETVHPTHWKYLSPDPTTKPTSEAN